MSASVNKVILIGNLGVDPDLKYTPSNRAVCTLSIATSESFKDKGGQRQERVEWHRVVVWGDTAEACSKYLKKGRPAYVEGRLQTRSWVDKTGAKRYSTEIAGDRVVFLGGGGGSASGGGDPPSQQSWGGGAGGPDAKDPGEDIPF